MQYKIKKLKDIKYFPDIIDGYYQYE